MTTVRSLRVMLVLIAVGALGLAWLLPVVAADTGRAFPEVRHLVVPFATAAVLTMGCLLTALVAVWHLLTEVCSDRIFRAESLRWVDLVISCGVGATLLTSGVTGHLLFVEGLGGPGIVLMFLACSSCGAALVLLMVVMRRLLAAAAADRRELAGVV